MPNVETKSKRSPIIASSNLTTVRHTQRLCHINRGPKIFNSIQLFPLKCAITFPPPTSWSPSIVSAIISSFKPDLLPVILRTHTSSQLQIFVYSSVHYHDVTDKVSIPIKYKNNRKYPQNGNGTIPTIIIVVNSMITYSWIDTTCQFFWLCKS